VERVCEGCHERLGFFSRMMCGMSLRDRKRTSELMDYMGVVSVDEVANRGRLRWYGHVERKDRSIGMQWKYRLR